MMLSGSSMYVMANNVLNPNALEPGEYNRIIGMSIEQLKYYFQDYQGQLQYCSTVNSTNSNSSSVLAFQQESDWVWPRFNIICEQLNQLTGDHYDINGIRPGRGGHHVGGQLSIAQIEAEIKSETNALSVPGCQQWAKDGINRRLASLKKQLQALENKP